MMLVVEVVVAAPALGANDAIRVLSTLVVVVIARSGLRSSHHLQWLLIA